MGNRNLESALKNIFEIAESIRLGKRQYFKRREINTFESVVFRYLSLEDTNSVVQRYPNRSSVVQAYLSIKRYYNTNIKRSRKAVNLY